MNNELKALIAKFNYFRTNPDEAAQRAAKRTAAQIRDRASKEYIEWNAAKCHYEWKYSDRKAWNDALLAYHPKMM